VVRRGRGFAAGRRGKNSLGAAIEPVGDAASKRPGCPLCLCNPAAGRFLTADRISDAAGVDRRVGLPGLRTSSKCVRSEQRRPLDERPLVLPDVCAGRPGILRRPVSAPSSRTGNARYSLHCALGAEAASNSGVRHVFQCGPVEIVGNALDRRHSRLVHLPPGRIQALPGPRDGLHVVVFSTCDVVVSGHRSGDGDSHLDSSAASLRAGFRHAPASRSRIHNEHSVFPVGRAFELLPVSGHLEVEASGPGEPGSAFFEERRQAFLPVVGSKHGKNRLRLALQYRIERRLRGGVEQMFLCGDRQRRP
jgi:hypothetical protein